MDIQLEKLLKRINLENIYLDNFNNAKIEKVVIDKHTNYFTFFLKLDNILPYKVYSSLEEKLTSAVHDKIKIEIKSDTTDYSKINEYWYPLIEKISLGSTRYNSLKDRKLETNNVEVILTVYNKIEELNMENIEQKLIKRFKQYGFNNIDFKINLTKVEDNELLKKIEEEKNVPTNLTYTKKVEPKEIVQEEKKSYFKPKKSSEITKIKDVIYEVENINIEAKIFNIDIYEAKSGYKIITLKVTDGTDSMYAKLFTKDDDEFARIKDLLKNGSWYQFYGKVSMDKYANELVFMTRYKDITKVEGVSDTERMDNAEYKRVELHAHTMMSQMDGVIDEVKLVKTAMKWGHSAIAITDHDGCQAFPHVFNEVTSYNKKLEAPYKDKIKELEAKLEENKENAELSETLTKEIEETKESLKKLKRFKALYGTELEMSDDNLDVVVNPTEDDLQGATYVIFDTETTGFNPGLNDQMIEIGAVKMKNGAVLENFDELINPGVLIDSEITNLTGITNAMVKNCPNEEEVTKKFKEWIGDLPLVAHNAKFDKNMLEMAYHKYNLGPLKNTILDTLQISRLINKDLKRHNLTALTKNYGITFEENDGTDTTKHHHRADYDAEFTGYVFFKMLAQLDKTDIKTFKDLANLPTELETNMYNREVHINMIARNRNGLKNMFKIISYASTKYLVKSARIPKHIVKSLREDILLGSGCYNGEIFQTALTRCDDDLKKVMEFYDYIEVQPPSNYEFLVARHDINSKEEVLFALNKIIRCAKEMNKIIVATSDAHTLNKEDKIYREIIVNQNVPGKGRHPLSRYLNLEGYMTIPDQYLRTTDEMLEEFNFLPDDLAKEIVITNTNKIPELCEIIEVIIDTGGRPFAPKIENSEQTVKDLVYGKAKSWYGDPLPQNIEERIEQELKGILGGHFDVIYLIAQKLVKHSNDEGFIVGSRGSVGSSFVATMMGITEVNPLPAHYRCPNCKYSIFESDEGNSLGATYSSGFDLPDKMCPKCGTRMTKDGQDMPFATFLGFNADKVPDIDLNFSDLNQASAHNYTKVLFGEDNVYRAGTIGTVAEKTAFGYVKGFCEDRNITMRSAEIERIAEGCTGVKRTTGQHPGGIVVIPGYMDVFDFTPFQYPADDPTSAWRTTHFDYHAIDQDVLKLDILGHTDPTQLRMIQELTGDDITQVPLDDKETMAIFLSPEPLGVTKEQIMNETGTLGIPEFGTPFTISMLVDTKPKTFAELIKISGLSHGTDVWLGNAQELIRSKTVEFKDVIGCRDDIMVYLMYNGLEPLKAFKIMEFVRKGKATKDPETWKKHVETMKQAGIEDWFIESCHKIKYMFPKAHAAAYVISAFRIAYYKVHFPAIYYCTYFSTRFDDFDINVMIKGYNSIKNKIIEINNKGYDATNKESSILETLKLALEATARGITFGNLDLIKSDAKNFIIDEDGTTLIPPFRSIDGLGGVVADNICQEAKKKPFISIEEFQKRCKVSTTLVDKMKAMNLFGDLPETSQLSLF